MKIEFALKEIDCCAEVDLVVEDLSFDHAFGTRHVLDLVIDIIDDFERNGREINFDKLRRYNQEVIEETIKEIVDEIDIKEYLKNKKEEREVDYYE